MGDDGTMDTVIVDTETGNEYRYNYDGSPGAECEQHEVVDCEVESCGEKMYDDFVKWALEDCPELVEENKAYDEMWPEEVN